MPPCRSVSGPAAPDSRRKPPANETGSPATPPRGAAPVYDSVLGGATPRRAPLSGLDSARGVLQAKIGRELGLRRTPQLAFTYDESVERGVRMSKLIDELAAELPEDDRDPDDE